MKNINKNLNNNIDYLKRKTGNSEDIIIKELSFSNIEVSVIFNETLTDKEFIDKFVLLYFTSEIKNQTKIKTSNILEHLEKTIPTHKTIKISDFNELFYYLSNGFTIIIIDGYDEALSLETKVQLDSGVLEAKNEQIIKGPKDAFSENYQTNIGLIRKRIKSEDLWLKEIVIGTKTKNRVGILYVQDIASKDLVEAIIKKIENISIDGILDSNYIIEMISGNKKSTFPNYISTERPDVVCIHLLEGRIAIVVENTQIVIVIPAVFTDLFQTAEDYYQKVPNVNFTRIIRLIAFLITILIPSLYVSISTFNLEAIPNELLISFISQRQGVPLPTILETLIMIIIFDILREADTRLPNAIGSSLSIVGAIVLGQAAVTASLVSPITIIVVSITAISGMISSNMDMINGIRVWRIIFLLFAAFFGVFGVIMAGFIFTIYLASIKSFGLPFLTPIAPFYSSEQNNAIFLTNKRKFRTRPNYTARKNKYRTGDIK